MKFSEELYKFRVKNSLTQVELGEKLNVSGPMIAQYETSAKVPNAFLAVKIARLLGTTVEYLFGGEGEK